MRGHFVHVPTTYRFRTQEEIAAEAAQPSKAVAPEPEEPAIDLDAELSRLDDCLQKLDELVAKEQEFPRHIAEIDTRLRKLEGEDLSTLEALESRQAHQGKLANMKLLADSKAKKTQAAIGSQQEIAIKIGPDRWSLGSQMVEELRRAG